MVAADFPLRGGSSYALSAAVAANVDALVAAHSNLRLMGFFCREIDGTPAVASFTIIHGALGSSGDAVIPVELAANESAREWFGPDGIQMPNGISVLHNGGTFDITLVYKKEVP